MFSSHRQLINTPKDNQRGKRGTGLEFTPIGGARRSALPSNGYIPMLQRNVAFKSNAETGSPLHKNSIAGSTFDDTYEENMDSEVFRGADILPDFSDNEEQQHHFERERDNAKILENGTNPLRKQHDQVKSLKEENLNLRIELMTWKKYLDGQPQDKVELVNKNIELSQENVSLKDRLFTLQQQVSQENKENLSAQTSPDKNLRERLLRYEDQINAYESKILEYQSRHEDLQKELEEARDGDEREKEDLEDALSREKKRALDLENELYDLKQEMNILENEKDQLKDAKDDLESTLNRLMDEIGALKEKASHRHGDSEHRLSEFTESLEEANQFIEELERKLDGKDQEVRDLKAAIEALRQSESRESHQISESSRKLRAENRELQEEVEKLFAKHERDNSIISKLKSDLKELEYALSHKAQSNVNDSYVDGIETERSSLYDSLIELNDQLKREERLTKELQESLVLKNSEIESLQRKLEQASLSERRVSDETEIIEALQSKLIHERNKFVEEVNKLDNKYTEDKSQLYDKISQLQREKTTLIEDYESIQIEYKRLLAKLEEQPQDNEALRDLEHDFKKLSMTYAAKCDEFDDRQLVANSTISRLEDELEYKKLEINRLTLQIDKLTNALSQNSRADRHEQELKLKQLMDEKMNLEDRYNSAVSENRRLRRQLDLTKSKEVFDNSQYYEAELNEVSLERDELLKDLQAKKRELNEIKWKLEDASKEKESLLVSIAALDEEQQKVTDENLKLSKELDSLRDKVTTSGSKQELTLQLEAKEVEIKKLVNDYNSMKNDLLSRYEKLRVEKLDLSKEVQELASKLERAKVAQQVLLSKQQQQQQQYPPTPKTPSTTRHVSYNQSPLVSNELELLQNQKKLFKLKLQQYKDCNSDLKFEARFLSTELENKERILASSIKALEGTDSVKRWHNKESNRTFRSVALAVLASVRLKNRLEELKAKKAEESRVKKLIQRCK